MHPGVLVKYQTLCLARTKSGADPNPDSDVKLAKELYEAEIEADLQGDEESPAEEEEDASRSSTPATEPPEPIAQPRGATPSTRTLRSRGIPEATPTETGMRDGRAAAGRGEGEGQENVSMYAATYDALSLCLM
jgi:hypothetical protein